MLLSIHEFMLSVALFVKAVQCFVYRSIFSKAAEKCLMKEENVPVKVVNLFQYVVRYICFEILLHGLLC